MTDLRTRRHRQTRDDIVDAALRLFRSHGYAQVTTDQIADAAGVSRRTLYRRFPTKEQMLLALPHEWLEVWDGVVTVAPDDAPAMEVVHAAALAVGRHIDASRARVLAVYDILDQVPSLELAFLANASWARRIIELLADSRRGPIRDEAIAHVIAGAHLGATDAMMAHWSATGGQTRVVDETRAVLDRLRPIWDE